MEIAEIKKKLRDYLFGHFKVAADDPDFNDDVHLFDYGYVDSFGAVDLISFVETSFGIKISQADLVAYPMNTINEIATFASLRAAGEL
jgi:methoxymalonate biosynthesis acyl carrier protein